MRLLRSSRAEGTGRGEEPKSSARMKVKKRDNCLPRCEGEVKRKGGRKTSVKKDY